MTTPTARSRALAPDVDPVRFEVIRNALLAITEEMGATLLDESGDAHLSAARLSGAKIRLDYPSVGATENSVK